jgi:O-antigen/teichoic acid export membrane protein
MSFVASLQRMVPGALASRLAPAADILDSILHDSDDRSVSRRIALFSFGVRIVSAAIAYASQVLLARWMGDFEYGIFVVVWVGAVILGGLACLGFQTALLRFVPEYTELGEDRLLRGVIFGSRVNGFIAATLFAVIGVYGLYAFGDHLESYYLIPLYLGAVTLPMLAIGEIHDGLSRAFNWADLSLWPTFVVRPLLIILFMWLALLNGAEANAITAMGSVIAATYITSIGQLVWLERRIRRAVPHGPRDYAPARWILLALPIFVVEGFFSLLTNVDILIVGHFMAPDQVAIYFAAAKTLALVHFIYFAVRVGGAQRFSQYHAAGDTARLTAFVRDTLHWTFWPSLAMVGLLLVFGKYLLLLFGPSFTAGYPLLWVLSIGLLLRASIGPAETLLIMAGQQRRCAGIYTGAFILNVVLNFVLIPRFGLMGAACTYSLQIYLLGLPIIEHLLKLQ